MFRDERLFVWSLLFSFLIHTSLVLASYLIIPYGKTESFRIEFTPERFYPSNMAPGMGGGGARRGMQMWRGGEGGPMALPGPPGLPGSGGFGGYEGREGTGLASIWGKYPYWPGERGTGPLGKEGLKGGKGKGLGYGIYSMVPPKEMRRAPGGPRQPFDLKYELLRIQDLEKSRYGAIAIIDPGNKRNLTGYVRLGLVVTSEKKMSNDGLGLSNIAWYINKQTKIKATAVNRLIKFREGDLLSFAVAFLTAGDTLKTVPGTKQDVEFFGDFLSKGGFLFVSGGNSGIKADDQTVINYGNTVYYQIKSYMKRKYGQQCWSNLLDSTQPIFHSFFDIESYVDLTNRFNANLEAPLRTKLEGLWLKDRLVAVYDPTPFPSIQISLPAQQERSRSRERARSQIQQMQQEQVPPNVAPKFQMATNAAIYAVTQPGSLALQYYKEPETPPERREVEEQKGYLAIIKKGASVREIDLSQIAMVLDGRTLGRIVKATGFDGMLFRNLNPGKHRVRIEYSGKSAEAEFDLKNGSVTTLAFGMDRFLFVTRLWMKRGDNLRKYDDWKERQSNLRIAEITGITD